jgi:hypothetical protein
MLQISGKYTFAIEAIGIDRAQQHPDWLWSIRSWDTFQPVPNGPLGEDLTQVWEDFRQSWKKPEQIYTSEYLKWLRILSIEAAVRLPDNPDYPERNGRFGQLGSVYLVPFDLVLRPHPELIIIGALHLDDGMNDVDRWAGRLDDLITAQESISDGGE